MNDPAGREDARVSLYRKITWRLLPILMIGYVFAYLDRVNIGFAKLQMQGELHLSDAAYGVAAGIFFLGYVLFELPSNLLLPRVGARRTFARILFLWGVTSSLMMFVRSDISLYILRFLLGVFEAGYAPGVLLYLTYWYPKDRLGRVLSVNLCAGPLSGMLGAPLSGWLMNVTAGALGLSGWQWLFLMEGLPCVLLAILVSRVIVDRPEAATWLSQAEKEALARDLGVQAPRSSALGQSLRAGLREPSVLPLAYTYFCCISGIYAIGFWLPSLLVQAGAGSTLTIGLYSALPYAAAIPAMVYWGRRSDRYRERRWHAAGSGLLGALSLALAAHFGDHLVMLILSLTVASAAIWAAYSVFWAIPMEVLRPEAAPVGIAVINSLGLLGGFVSPTLIGWLRTTGALRAGLLAIVALLVSGSMLLLAIRPGALHKEGDPA